MHGVSRREHLFVAATRAPVVDGARRALLPRHHGPRRILGRRVRRRARVVVVFVGAVAVTVAVLGVFVLDSQERIPVDVVQRRVLPRQARTELLFGSPAEPVERARGVLWQVAARTQYFRGHDGERVRGGGRGWRRPVRGRVQGLLAGPEQLLGVVGLQRDVVREVTQQVGEDGEGLRGREGGELACIANWTRQSGQRRSGQRERRSGRGAGEEREQAPGRRASLAAAVRSRWSRCQSHWRRALSGRRVSAPRDLAPLAVSASRAGGGGGRAGQSGRERARGAVEGAEGAEGGGWGGGAGERASERVCGCAEGGSQSESGSRGVVEPETDPS